MPPSQIPPARLEPPHDVDRALPELLQELRVTQTGGQLFFAFLFSVAFTPVFQRADEGQRLLYLWDLAVVAASMVVLVMPVAMHRASFGLRNRPLLLRVNHVTTMVGLALLALGLVLGLVLISSFVVPGAAIAWLPIAGAAVVALAWIVVPLAVRARAPGRPSATFEPPASGDDGASAPHRREEIPCPPATRV